MDNVNTPTWRKSMRSTGNGGSCVELMVVESQNA